jgi:DeoR family transcriptional regulator, fructose operon transcriptional repressor
LLLINFEQNKNKSMSFQNRKQKILQIIEQKGEVSVKDLAEFAETSEVTIRRDLIQLANDGLLYRTHGGAMPLSSVNSPIGFLQKSAQNAEAKDHICRLAAQEIQDGDVILMDCGSTVFRLCQFIKNKRIKVVTNSLPVVYELINSEVSLNLIGGEIDPERQAVHGSVAVEHIKRYSVDKAFLGVGGISIQKGLTALSEKEAQITLAMMKQAKSTYFLCDSSKINRDKYLQFADIEVVKTVITDAGDELVKGFRDLGIRVLN